MSTGIGIDTGGTYTDCVVYDFKKKKIIAKGKALTTRHDLTLGIQNAMKKIPYSILEKASMLSISTTLATNACVENKGVRAKLLILGSSDRILNIIDIEREYGTSPVNVLFADAKTSYDGKTVKEPDWDEVISRNKDWFSEAGAIGVAEVYALRNGAALEKKAKEILEKKLNIPVIKGEDLTDGPNVLERGTTAMLNAGLLPVIEEFLIAIKTAISSMGLKIPYLIVRSDTGLMTGDAAFKRPVETILSGPAASVMGGRHLTEAADSIIIDMGGTTTDISIVKDTKPVMTQGIRIGNWRTQVKGVFTDTFGLGGDSEVYMKKHSPFLGSKRLEPMCAAANKWPEIKESLKKLLKSNRSHIHPIYEFLYIVKMPVNKGIYNQRERNLLELLKKGPVMLGDERLDVYNLNTKRLEAEGVIMRCGLTPTDAMHIRGDYSAFDREASVLAAKCFLKLAKTYTPDDEGVLMLAEDIYNLVCKKLYQNIARVLLQQKYGEVFSSGPDRQTEHIISSKWEEFKENKKEELLDIDFTTGATLVGIGAPVHIFLPEVAKALNTKCIIPPHSEVANALGTVITDITAVKTVEVTPEYSKEGITGYTLHSEDVNILEKDHAKAIELAKNVARQKASEKARELGAEGKLKVNITVEEDICPTLEGVDLDLGTKITATASGNPG